MISVTIVTRSREVLKKILLTYIKTYFSPGTILLIYLEEFSKKSLGIMLTIVLIGAHLLAGCFVFLYKRFKVNVKLDDIRY